MTRTKYAVGDTVKVLDFQSAVDDRRRLNARLIDGEVVKVARAIVTVKVHGRECRFGIEDGRQRSDFPMRLTSVEKEREHAEKVTLRDELRDLGIGPNHAPAARLSAESMRAIVAIVKADAAVAAW